MRKSLLGLAAIAALGLALPAAALALAQDAKVVIKTGDRDHGPRFDRDRRKVVIIKRDGERRMHRDHDARKTVIIHKRGFDARAEGSRKVIIKRD